MKGLKRWDAVVAPIWRSGETPGAIPKSALLAISALALIPRLLWVLLNPNWEMGGWADQGGEIALNLLDGRGYVYEYVEGWVTRSFRPPVFPLFLFGLWSVFGYDLLLTRVVIAIVSAVNVFLVGLLAGKICDRRAALLGAVLAALFPPFIYWPGVTLGTETLSMTLLLVTLYLVTTERYAAAGGAAGILALTRSVLFPFALLLAGWILLRRRARPAAAYVAALTIVLLPWIARNWIVHEELFLLSSEGGYVAVLTNNPESFAQGGRSQPARYIYNYAETAAVLSEVQLNRFFMSEARGFVLADPVGFARSFVLRIGRLWRPLPSEGYSAPVSLLMFVTWTPLFVLACVQLYRRRLGSSSDVQPLLLAILWVTIAAGLFEGVVRYRAPVEPLVIVLAAAALADITARRSSIRQEPHLDETRGRRLHPYAN